MRFKEKIKGMVFGPWGRIYGSLTPIRPVPSIETLLARANGRRRVRLLNRGDIDEIIQDCREADDGYWASISGGRAHYTGWISRSTFAFSARIDVQHTLASRRSTALRRGRVRAGGSCRISACPGRRRKRQSCEPGGIRTSTSLWSGWGRSDLR